MDEAPVKVRLIIADDHAAWRGGVRSMLDDTQFEIVGEAASGTEAIKLVIELKPRLLLLDIRMPDGDGLDALESIKQTAPRSAVVMLTTYENPSYVDRAVAAGAAGYLLKGTERDEIVEALTRVSIGEMLLKQYELRRSLNQLPPPDPGYISPSISLTARERQLLQLISIGLSNQDIVAAAPNPGCTVTMEVERIMDKLNVSDRVQAAVWAARHGIARRS